MTTLERDTASVIVVSHVARSRSPAVVSIAGTAYAVWTDNRDINPTASAAEDADPATDLPALINARSRDANIYFDKIAK